MPLFANLAGLAEALAPYFFLAVPITLGLLIAIVAFGIAWGGRRVGMLFGVLALIGVLVGLGGLLLTAPQLWWIAVFPIGLSAGAVRAWYRHSGPATARPPRFDLRGMFALILCVALILGGATSEYRQTQVEKAAAARIEALTGSTGNVSWRFDRVHGVLFNTPVSPADFDQAADALEKLSQLHVLQINDVNLPATITERLGRLTTLRTLIAQNVPVTDDDLRPLANLHNLETLDLDASQLTDAGLVHLSGLKRLRLLHLYDANQITPAAMAKLRAGLPRLTHP